MTVKHERRMLKALLQQGRDMSKTRQAPPECAAAQHARAMHACAGLSNGDRHGV